MSDSESHPPPTSRRQYLSKAAVTAAVPGAALTAAVGKAAAEIDDYDWSDDGDYIERTDDLDEIRAYMPYLRISPDSRRQLIGLYGWKAQSPDHDTDAYYIWARYTHQDAAADDLTLLDRAFSVFASDSHLWDHEPSIIYVDPQTGEIEKAVVTGYHHFPLEITNPTLSEGEIEGHETHLNLNVVDPWHHYTHDRLENGVDVTNFARFESWLEHRDSWIDNGFYENSNPVAIDNPWSFLEDTHSWWAEGTWDYRAGKWWNMLGLRGADDATNVRFD
ncbi:hypothetical protein [Natronorubrum sp. DTA7]|uniref:hypothetical protein n=1 Tax=Natronorubrum sp. DTA7 TaxID=3447016 RepID=UPI003F8304D1